MRNRKATTADFLIAGFLFLLVLAVVVPFINTIAISFSTQREYLNTPLLLIPRKPTLNNYIKLDIENPIIRINTAFKGCSSLEKISVLPRIYHN